MFPINLLKTLFISSLQKKRRGKRSGPLLSLTGRETIVKNSNDAFVRYILAWKKNVSAASLDLLSHSFVAARNAARSPRPICLDRSRASPCGSSLRCLGRFFSAAVSPSPWLRRRQTTPQAPAPRPPAFRGVGFGVYIQTKLNIALAKPHGLS